MRRSKEVGKRQSRPSSPSRPSRSDPSPPRSRKSTLSSSASAVDNLEVVASEKQDPFTSGSELFDEPRSFPYSVKQQCWEKAEKVKGRDPDRWRRDPLGVSVAKEESDAASVDDFEETSVAGDVSGLSPPLGMQLLTWQRAIGRQGEGESI